MLGFRIDTVKGCFFDSHKVLAAVGRAERQVLSRFGAFVRRSARQSIRKRKKVSERGKPPSSHVGLLRRFIFFAYDAHRRSVVIGPVRLTRTPGDAPRALEYGGSSQVNRKGKPRRIVVAARPFMGPALEKEKPGLSAMWRDSVR